jgi:tetratricopeptide (TPR) repeat protein
LKTWEILRPALLIALLATVFLVYWPGLGGGFVFDDIPNIVDNTALHVTRPVWNDWLAAMMSSVASELQRPLAMLTFATNYYFTGLDPRPMKLTNVAIHAFNAALVFGLIRIILLTALKARDDAQKRTAEWLALFITACWALHPINLMAVLFVVQRMESLSHTFVFAGLWLYVSGRRRQLAGANGWGMILTGLVPCTVIGLLAKESAALLPLYALCIECCLFRFCGKDDRRDPRLYAVFVGVLVLPALLGVAWLLPRAMGPGAFASRNFSLAERLMTEPRVVLTYMRWTFLPDLGQLSLYHDDYLPSRGLWNPPSTLASLLAIPGLLAVAWLCRKRRPLLSLGLLWFLAAQLLTATIIPLELVFEHRNYFASLGLCLALADLLLLAPGTGLPRRTGALFAIGFLLICAGITYLRAIEWSDQVRFSVTEAAKHPQSPRATYDVARTMVILTDYRPDSPFTARALSALEHAREVPRCGVLPDQAILMFAAHTGRPLKPVWWEDMYDKLRHQPIGPQELAALAALTKCTTEQHCPFPRDNMLKMYNAASSHGPNAEVLNIYADYVQNVLRDSEHALRMWRQASALRPGEAQYHISLAKLLMAMGRYEEARAQIAQLRTSGRLGQNEAEATTLEIRLQHIMQTQKNIDRAADR